MFSNNNNKYKNGFKKQKKIKLYFIEQKANGI